MSALDLDTLRDAVETAERNDDQLHLEVELARAILAALERPAGLDQMLDAVAAAMPPATLFELRLHLADAMRRGRALVMLPHDAGVLTAALERAERVEAAARNLDGAVAAHWIGSEFRDQEAGLWGAVQAARGRLRAVLDAGSGEEGDRG